MTTDLAARKDAIKARIAEVYNDVGGYGYFSVTLTRPTKHRPRRVKIAWTAYPYEADVQAALGDLYDETTVALDRTRLWSCGNVHDDSMDAWQAHEGHEHLEYEGPRFDELVLTDETEAELRADGETFESDCVPGNYVPCPTCGGTGRVLTGPIRNMAFTPCPECTRLGLDRNRFPGILDLDQPDHLAAYQGTIDAVRAKARAGAEADQRKREAAMSEPTTFAAPQWQPLPTRDAGILNGLPVAEHIGCDYLTHADDSTRRVLCRAEARWFDPTTGLRVCTRHKTNPRNP